MPPETGQIWRPFTARERKQIEVRLSAPDGASCPRCGDILEARRLARHALAHELECHDCRRYYARALQAGTPESLYLLRIQKLAIAILRA
ncbi:MAG: hypothetical protein ACT443_12250 [Gemmatimonadota bacterium]